MIYVTTSDLVFALTSAARYAEERGAYTIAVCHLPPEVQDEATTTIAHLFDTSSPSTVDTLGPSWLALEDALAEVRSWRDAWAAEGSTGNEVTAYDTHEDAYGAGITPRAGNEAA